MSGLAASSTWSTWVDGTLLPLGVVPSVSILDRGYLLGDSVFETLRARNGVVLDWSAHWEIFRGACAGHRIECRFDEDEVLRAACEVVSRLAVDDVTLRLTLSRGRGGRGVSPGGSGPSTLSWLGRTTTPYPASAYVEGIDTSIVGPRRIPAACLDPRFKTGCYLPTVIAKAELEEAGLVEGVMLSVDGQIASGCVSNVFFVFDDYLVTPWPAADCRLGVMRANVLRAAARLGMHASERRVMPDEVARAREMFFTNTLMECLPVRALGESRFAAPGPLMTQLLTELRRAASAEIASSCFRRSKAARESQ